MTDYESVRSDWWALLKWHLKANGTRPNGNPQTQGRVWSEKDFAKECNVGDPDTPEHGTRTVYGWFERSNFPVPSNSHYNAIEWALFGNNRAYNAWRLDLRDAYQNAKKQKAALKCGRSTAEQLPPIQERSESNEPNDPDAFAFAVREGVLLRLKGQTLLGPNFLRSLAEHCQNKKLISEMTTPDQDIDENESLMGKLMANLVIKALRTREWTELDLYRVVHEAGHHLHGILLRKAHGLGICRKNAAGYAVDADALDSLAFTLDGHLPDQPTNSDICMAMYLSWRDVVTTAVENAPGEDKGYIDILSIFLYAVSYDNGSVRHLFITS
jgi:hypothetical protein